MSGDYRWFQKTNESKTTDVTVDATGAGSTLISPKSSNHQLFIQKIAIDVGTYATGSWTFREVSASGAILKTVTFPSAAVALPSEDGSIIIDWGPQGKALTVGTALVRAQSATGIGGIIHIEAYQKLGATVAMASTN